MSVSFGPAQVVELTPLAGKRIGSGGAHGGLSTEARKRLTIAVELVANPAIIFMVRGGRSRKRKVGNAERIVPE